LRKNKNKTHKKQPPIKKKAEKNSKNLIKEIFAVELDGKIIENGHLY